MVLTAGTLSRVLQALGSAKGLFKHDPGAGSQVRSPDVPLPVTQLAFNSSCTVPTYAFSNIGLQSFPPFDQTKATVYRYRRQQSVNLGSWFVHENWMTPSLFICAAGSQVSELDIASGWGSVDGARAVLERHWDTFINSTDFQYLASIGINTVRLPIGFWTLGPDFCRGTPYEVVAAVYQHSWSRLVRAINMAAEVGIGVLIDLHGAPGSQNGQPHSGVSDGQAGLWGNDVHKSKTLDVLAFLTRQLAMVTNVVGIQILNEPNNVDELLDFYATAIDTMRRADPAAASFPLYLHDGFDLGRFSDFVASRTDFVVEDHHSYFVFTSLDESTPASQHTSNIHDSIAQSLANASAHQRRNLVVNEFSCALTDQSLVNEANPPQARKDFCQGQIEVYRNNTAGWAFWSYDKEDCFSDPGWCFRAAVGTSLPSSFFPYGQGHPFPNLSAIPLLSYMNAEHLPLDVLSPTPSIRHTLDDDLSNHRRPMRQPRDVRHRSRVSGSNDDSDPLPDDPIQRAISKGYSDAFLTAKTFALFGMSKLGFTGQYIRDSITMLGSSIIESGTEHYYEHWFVQGLIDGETLIASYM